MIYHILTLFPEMIQNSINHSIIKRAVEKEIISINCINIRDFSMNKHNQVDDYAYGGGAGMVMKPEPIDRAYMSINAKNSTRVLYMTPKGKPFNQKIAQELSEETELVILCGHYEGVDERIINKIVTDEISIGDFILTGGELPAIMVVDATARLIKGVLGKKESFLNDSFSNELLEHPNYTRPFVFNEEEVPSVLISGNHKNIEKWKIEQSILETYKKRPDILDKYNMTNEEKAFLEQYIKMKQKDEFIL